MTNRRTFLQTTAAIATALILPTSLCARSHSFHFVHADTLDSWPVADPVASSSENAEQPVLERAQEHLVTLIPNYGERIIRLDSP